MRACEFGSASGSQCSKKDLLYRSNNFGKSPISAVLNIIPAAIKCLISWGHSPRPTDMEMQKLLIVCHPYLFIYIYIYTEQMLPLTF